MRFAVLLVTCVACGDNAVRAVPFDSTSGTRLRVDRYMFDDGTTLPASGGFFDAELHVSCTPQTWLDGKTRCVPDAEDAIFTDAQCMTAIGRGLMITKPKYFVGHDLVNGVSLASHLYKAGAPVAAPGTYYQRIGDQCAGPFFTPSEDVYYALTGEYDPPIELTDSIVGDGRLQLRVRSSSDGAITPLAFYDRDLAVDCDVSERAGSSAVCEPIGAPVASYFADALCTQPAVALPLTSNTPQPLVARLDHDGDCPTFQALGADVTSTLYRLDRGGCIAVARDPAQRYVALGEVASLLEVGRTVQTSPHRLHRILVATPELTAFGDHLVDTAVHQECARVQVGEVERCLPTSTLVALDLYAQGCAQRLPITAVPIRNCHPPAFAISTTDPVTLSAIGDVTTQTVYRFGSNGACTPYIPPDGQQLRSLGPPLPEDTFLAARAYGER